MKHEDVELEFVILRDEEGNGIVEEVEEIEPGQQELTVNRKPSHDYGSNGEPSNDPKSSEKNSKKISSSSITTNSKMKSFVEDYDQPKETSFEFIGDLTEAMGEAIFIDGSRYQGTWDALGMAGAGSFRLPYDVLYDGEMRDGMQHGQGTLEYPGKQRIDGVWNRGELKKRRYTFSDGLDYEMENWTYCKFPDRRFQRSKIDGLKPAGRSLKTQDQPTKIIPLGCYDAGDGIFDPSTLCVTNFEEPSKVVRIPTADECRWIISHCRKSETEPTGCRPWLNENWSLDPPELPYRLPMSKDSPEKWWQRIFTFERDTSVILDDRRRSVIHKNEDRTRLGRSSSILGEYKKCVCESEMESEIDSERQEEAPLEEFDVCGADGDSDESMMRKDIFRELVCEKMRSDEYEGEDAEKLLMTVCCPPEGTYTIMRRGTSTRSLRSRGQSTDDGEGARIYWGEEEEEEEEAEAEEDEEEEEEEEEEEDDEEKEKEGDEDEESIDWDEEVECEEFDYRDFMYDEMKKSMKRENGSSSHVKMLRLGGGVKSKKRLKKRKTAAGRIKKMKQIGFKKRKKRPCPAVINTEQLLQREVGDLLFSPALDAPRSPVYLVKKYCDRKVCKKWRARKYKISKCGNSLSPANLPAKKHKTRICINERKTESSNRKKICSPSRVFVTLNNSNDDKKKTKY